MSFRKRSPCLKAKALQNRHWNTSCRTTGFQFAAERLPRGASCEYAVVGRCERRFGDGRFFGDFKDYQAHDEQKILESVTWTLTQFDSIQKVSLKMNGKKLKAMPVAGTPVSPGGLTREAGINTDTKYVADITNTHPVTVYYLAETGGQSYYVPVTKRVANSSKDDVAAAVEELVSQPFPGFPSRVRIHGRCQTEETAGNCKRESDA